MIPWFERIRMNYLLWMKRIRSRVAALKQNIPSEYGPRILAEQIDSAARLSPFSATVTSCVAIVVTVAAWGKGHNIYLAVFLSLIEFCAALVVMASAQWMRAPAKSEGGIKAQRFGTILGGILGLMWSSMPLVLFASSGADLKLLIACTMAGLICTGLVIAPLVRASIAFILPMVFGSIIALALTSDTFFFLIAILMFIYAVFILSSILYLQYLFNDQVLRKIDLERQSEMIRLLMWDYDQSASDWFWEIDASQKLRNITLRFAGLFGDSAAALEGKNFFELLSGSPDSKMTPSDFQPIIQCFNERVFFKDVVLRVPIAGHNRWWSLTGRPFFDDHGNFMGYRGVGSDVTDARGRDALNAHKAHHDELTGLQNRGCFQDNLSQAIDRKNENQGDIALLSLDLDGFKKVNDTYGHLAGDDVLRMVARRLTSVIRGDDKIFRLGGDEFSILHYRASRNSAALVSERIIEVLRQPFSFEFAEIFIGVSIGIAFMSDSEQTTNDFIHKSDIALYCAKSAGKGIFLFFDESLPSMKKLPVFLSRDLMSALKDGQFRIVYQPIIVPQTSSVRGFEALLRWDHPTHGMMRPSEFIHLAEEANLLDDIGEWVLREACLAAVEWPSTLRVAVNVSASQLQHPDFLQIVSDVLSATGLDPFRLELELTETVAIYPEVAYRAVRHLRNLGIRMALDDFGTGYSTLENLNSFMFDKIKIDRKFVMEMMSDRRSAMIVHSIIGLAANLGIATTAEGVETIEQLQLLMKYGCTEVQGFLFSQPINNNEIISYIRQSNIKKSHQIISINSAA